MITSNKRIIQSQPYQSNVNCGGSTGQGPGILTPVSGNTSKKKQKKEQKKVGTHQRKLSDNRIFYQHNNIVIANGNIHGPAIAYTNGNLLLQNNNINNMSPSNNIIINNVNNIPNNNNNLHNINNNTYLNQPSSHFHSNEHYISNNSPSSHYQDDETGSSDSNQDIKNKLLSLLTQKNDSKKMIASKSSGNSLDFAIGEFGRRKKSPQNLINNNYNIGGLANNHYHLGKKSPSKMKNLLYFQEKTTNKSQIQNNSSTHFVLSPKEPKNINNVFQQIKSSKKDLYLQLYQNQQSHQQSFSPILGTVIKSKGLSPEKKESLSPSRENLKNIIAAQKYINHGISPSRGSGGGSNSSGNLVQVESKTAFKKKLSVPKPLYQETQQQHSKQNNSKERIINLFNTKQEALTDHNTRKSSTVSKKHKSVSPENQQQMQKSIKKAISNTLAQQIQTSQKQKPFFKKYRPPELEEIHSTNTISQSVPNSSKHNIQNTFNTPNNQNLNNQHGIPSSSHNETKKFYFDQNLTSNSQFINSQTINPNTLLHNINLNNINSSLNFNNSTNNPYAFSSNPNNISNSVNYSHSARSNNQISSAPQSNPLYQNYINPYINTSNTNQSKIISAAINYNLKNAENRLMKIQEDMHEGGEQSNTLNEQLQKTFLRTSKLLSGYKTRELKWEQEKRALVDEIKFLKNLLYTEQFDDLVINSQMNCFIYNFACFALVICALCA